MERPKSAKYNMERYKKSSAFASKFNKTQNTIDNDLIIQSQSPQLSIEDTNSNRRFQTSKSAFVGNVTKLRPQSARHNLEKYRQDVLIDQQKLKLQQQKFHQLQPCQTPSLIDETNVDVLITQHLDQEVEIEVEVEEEEEEDDDDDLDNLEGLLIREEDSSSELDSVISMSNNDLSVPKAKNKKNNSNKKSLLAKRAGSTSNSTVLTVGPQVVVNSSNLPNKTANLNHYTTFRPTAVTTNYSTSLQQSLLKSNTFNNSNLNLIKPQSSTQKNQNQNQSNNYGKVVHLHPEHLQKERDVLNAEQTLDQTSGSTNTTITSNSSSSSTSSSSKLQQQEQIQQAHLNRNEQIKSPLHRSKKIEHTSRELLNDWLKNDDEIDFKMSNNLNNLNNLNNPNISGTMNTNDSFMIPNRQQVIIQKQPLKQQQQNRLLIQQRLLNNASGRTSRFSDYSSNSNVNTNLLSSNNSIINGREKSSFIDPWAKRNPTLIAQNVLMKHKAELDQMSMSRTTNNTSRTSNTPSIMTHSTAVSSASVSRYLLPDTKYFKK